MKEILIQFMTAIAAAVANAQAVLADPNAKPELKDAAQAELQAAQETEVAKAEELLQADIDAQILVVKTDADNRVAEVEALAKEGKVKKIGEHVALGQSLQAKQGARLKAAQEAEKEKQEAKPNAEQEKKAAAEREKQAQAKQKAREKEEKDAQAAAKKQGNSVVRITKGVSGSPFFIGAAVDSLWIDTPARCEELVQQGFAIPV